MAKRWILFFYVSSAVAVVLLLGAGLLWRQYILDVMAFVCAGLLLSMAILDRFILSLIHI